jgi:hypothetical protein
MTISMGACGVWLETGEKRVKKHDVTGTWMPPALDGEAHHHLFSPFHPTTLTSINQGKGKKEMLSVDF